MTTKAAGILFVSAKNNALFLRRSKTAVDFPNNWDFPGGSQEGDETAEQTALREAQEEVGKFPKGNLVQLVRSRPTSLPDRGIMGATSEECGCNNPPASPQPSVPDVDFTTFLQRVTDEFTPALDDEHDGWAWAPIEAPPEPLHPGCRMPLDFLRMDELAVARAIAQGNLPSPQRYENVMLWAIRITGTGASFRPKENEFVFRNKEIHLNPDALARWNGSPVVFRHPKKGLLDSKEFGESIV